MSFHIVLFFSLTFLFSYGSNTGPSSNGLLYSEDQISRLRVLVHQKLENWDYSRDKGVDRGVLQSVGHVFILNEEGSELSDIFEAISSLGDPAAVVKQYKALVEKQIPSVPLILDMAAGSSTGILMVPGSPYNRMTFDFPSILVPSRAAGTWLSDRRNDQLRIVFIREGFSRPPIPKTYSSWLHYSRRLLKPETPSQSTQLGTSSLTSTYKDTKQFAFYNSFDFLNFEQVTSSENPSPSDYKSWQRKRREHMISEINKHPKIRILYDQALAEAEAGLQVYDSDFEELVYEIGQKSKALNLMKNRKIYTNCGNDLRPQWHKYRICQISAELGLLDVFLKHQLSNLNSSFLEQSPENSVDRRTFVKELKVMGIDVKTLLLSRTLRHGNISYGQYSRGVWAEGRAFSDFEDPRAFEVSVKKAIFDPKLDLYNRSRMLLLYLCYLNYVGVENGLYQVDELEGLLAESNQLHGISYFRLTVNEFKERLVENRQR